MQIRALCDQSSTATSCPIDYSPPPHPTPTHTATSQGAGTIARLVGEAGLGCVIMAAGGITEDNVADVISRTGVREVHSSAARMCFSRMQHRAPGMTLVSSKLPSDYAWRVAQEEVVRLIKTQATAAARALPR